MFVDATFSLLFSSKTLNHWGSNKNISTHKPSQHELRQTTVYLMQVSPNEQCKQLVVWNKNEVVGMHQALCIRFRTKEQNNFLQYYAGNSKFKNLESSFSDTGSWKMCVLSLSLLQCFTRPWRLDLLGLGTLAYTSQHVCDLMQYTLVFPGNCSFRRPSIPQTVTS